MLSFRKRRLPGSDYAFLARATTDDETRKGEEWSAGLSDRISASLFGLERREGGRICDVHSRPFPSSSFSPAAIGETGHSQNKIACAGNVPKAQNLKACFSFMSFQIYVKVSFVLSRAL